VHQLIAGRAPEDLGCFSALKKKRASPRAARSETPAPTDTYPQPARFANQIAALVEAPRCSEFALRVAYCTPTV